MEAVSENKQRCDAYKELLMEVRRKVSDLLGVNLRMETSMNGSSLEAKLFGPPISGEKQYEMTSITITPEKECLVASTDQNRIPGNGEYAKAFLSKNLKYTLSQKPIIGMFLFRKEKERIDKINKIITATLTGKKA